MIELRSGWEKAASVPWNLPISVVFSDEELAEVVRGGFRRGEGVVALECCFGAKSPNIAELLSESDVGAPWTSVDGRGYIVFSDGKKARSRPPALGWREPYWEERPLGAFAASFDHHGDRDGEPGAFSQVYHSAFGCLHNHPKPRLVLSAGIDEDMIGAAVAAVAAVPHPHFFPHYYPDLREEAARALTRDMSALVSLVDTVDTEIHRVLELVNTGLGCSLLTWRESIRPEFKGAFLIGHACQRFIELFCLGGDVDAQRTAIQKRQKRLQEITQVPQRVLGDGLVIVADLTGYDANSAFYQKLLEQHPFGVFVLGDWATGRGRITFAARSMEDAVRHLGPTGLKAFYRCIPGAGGHPNLGGAPWGGNFSFDEEGMRFGRILVEMIEKYQRKQEASPAQP